MKNRVIAITLPVMFSVLMVSAVIFLPSAFSPVLAAQLFGRDSKQDKTRLLTGKVLDNSDNPVPNAVVYLTNTHTRSVKTYIVGPDGTYRFPALLPSIDYEVYAQYNKSKSGTKTVSQFDDRSQVYITLKVNVKADAKDAK
jgi:hypothetical protein